MDKIVYALNLIVDFIYFNDHVNEKHISEYLRGTGFDECEVRQVLALLDIETAAVFPAFRVFSYEERLIFSQDAINYMNKLLLSGLLDLHLLEDVIERAYSLNSTKININLLKEIVMIVLCDKQLSNFSTTLEKPMVH